MDRLVADYQRMAALAEELGRLVQRLDLGDAGYLRGAMRPDVTGSNTLSEACAAFEAEWDFGRDRLKTTLTKVASFLQSAAVEYAQSDSDQAVNALAAGMTDDQEQQFRQRVAELTDPEF